MLHNLCTVGRGVAVMMCVASSVECDQSCQYGRQSGGVEDETRAPSGDPTVGGEDANRGSPECERVRGVAELFFGAWITPPTMVDIVESPQLWKFTVESQKKFDYGPDTAFKSGAALEGTTTDGETLIVSLPIPAAGWSVSDQTGKTFIVEVWGAYSDCVGPQEVGGPHAISLSLGALRNTDGTLVFLKVGNAALYANGDVQLAAPVPKEIQFRWVDLQTPCPAFSPLYKEVALSLSLPDGTPVLEQARSRTIQEISIAGTEYTLAAGTLQTPKDGTFCGEGEWTMYRPGFLVHSEIAP